MAQEVETQHKVLAQQATYAALPCLSQAQQETGTLIAQCADQEDEIVAAMTTTPESILLLEQSSFTRSLVERLEALEGAPVTIVVRVEEVTPALLEECVNLGCMGVIQSSLSLTAFHRMLSVISTGEMWLERKWSSYVIRQLLTRQKGPKLSRREHDVLNLLRGKLKNREIAHALAISEETLRWHLRHLYAKTKRRSRLDLVSYAEALNSDEFRVRLQAGR